MLRFVFFIFIVIAIIAFYTNDAKKFSKIQFKSLPKSTRESIVQSSLKSVFSTTAILSYLLSPAITHAESTESKKQLEYMPALEGLDYGKPRTFYPDYIRKPSGLQYKVVKMGEGPMAKNGDRVVIDWEGYTIGYYGRPFQLRNKVKGGAFESSETDYYRWTVGSSSTIQALNEAVTYLPEGSIAQVIVPAELGYPVTGDSDHILVGPKPNTFSGLRALNFVLENTNLIDKTLLINIKVVRVDKGGKRGDAVVS